MKNNYDYSDDEINYHKDKKQKNSNNITIETRKRRNSEGDIYNLKIKERSRYDNYFNSLSRNKQIEILDKEEQIHNFSKTNNI